MDHTPEDTARLVQEALTQLGWAADPKRIAARVYRLNLGLPREDEFSVVCTWLGRCDLIHKLDQSQTPTKSRCTFQVPDLLPVFRHEDRAVPVLVEVKSSNDNSLSFQPDSTTGIFLPNQSVSAANKGSTVSWLACKRDEREK